MASDDLTQLSHLHEPAVLHSLQLRFDIDRIYTCTGPILLAVNPFKRISGLYRLEEDNAQLSRLVGQLGQEVMELRSLKTQEKKLVLQAQQRLAETGELRKKNVELIDRESTSAETVCISKALMH